LIFSLRELSGCALKHIFFYKLTLKHSPRITMEELRTRTPRDRRLAAIFLTHIFYLSHVKVLSSSHNVSACQRATFVGANTGSSGSPKVTSL
jgi:hypothetical protein